MEKQKQMFIMEFAQELQDIKYAYKEAMEIQRQSFQLKLEKINKKLEMVEFRVIVLEKEVQLLKNCKLILEKELALNTYANTDWQKQNSDRLVESSDSYPSLYSPAASNSSIIPSSSKVISEVKFTKPVLKSYIQIAVSNTTQNTVNNLQIKVTNNNCKCKGNTASLTKIKLE